MVAGCRRPWFNACWLLLVCDVVLLLVVAWPMWLFVVYLVVCDRCCVSVCVAVCVCCVFICCVSLLSFGGVIV